MSILIVEEEKAVTDLLSEQLREHGFHVRTAGDGEEALQMMREQRPKLVILEVILPKKDGFEVLEEMKEDEELKEIAVFFLTYLAHEEDVSRGLATGAADYLVDKSPAGIAELVGKVKRFFTSSSTP